MTLPTVFPSRRRTAVLLFLLAALQTGCKLVVVVPPGGKVVAGNGFECGAGERCVIEVDNARFDQTFTAVAGDGWSFLHWKRASRYFCGNKADPCRLTTRGFPGTTLESFLDTDEEFYLEPVFSSIDRDYWTQTLDEIDDETFASDGFLYSVAPAVASCDAGSLEQRARQRALEAVNQVRSLHGLAAVSYASGFDTQVQESSLVQAANNYLNHFPDPGDTCYSETAAEGARTSNLTGGSGVAGDPADHIFGWINDNNNVANLQAAGHRRWILFPQLEQVAYGQVNGFATLKVFDFGQAPMNALPAERDFVAMPYRSYPYALVSAGERPTPWSISMVPEGNPSLPFDYFSGATVTVTETESGVPLRVRSLHTDTDGFGLANFMSWMVDGWDYDTWYTVRVSDIRLPGGGARDVEYPVLLDRFNLVNLRKPLEATDSGTASLLQGSFNTPKDKDSYVVRLSGRVTFDGDSNFSNQAFFIRVYDDRKRLIASADDRFSRQFAGGRYTVIVSPCDENGLCYQNVATYSVAIL